MFYKIVDMLTVDDSVCFFDQDNDEVVESLVGSMNNPMQTLELLDVSYSRLYV